MLRRIPRPLALLLAVAALLSLAWTFTTTPFQGPDEPAHFNYTQHLVETGHKPSPDTGTMPDSSQVANALFFFNLDQLAGVADARPAWSRLEERRFDGILEEIGEAGEEDGAGPNPMAKNPPLYYAYQAPFYATGSLGSFWDRLVLMRLASGLLLLATVTLTWLAAAEVFRATWPRALAAGCVALLPQLTSLSGTINADNLLITAWTGFIWMGLRLVRRGPSAGRILALGGFAAASMLTHGRGVAIALPLLAVVALAVLRARPSLGQAVRWLGPSVLLLALALGAYVLLLAPGSGAYGGEIKLGGPTSSLSLKGFFNVTWQFYFPELPFMETRIGPEYGYKQVFIETFFGRFATLEVAYPLDVYALLQGVCAIGLAGLVAAVAGRWAAVRARWPEVAVLVVTTVSLLGLLHAASYRALVFTFDPLITGRYLLPIVAVAAIAVAFVLTSLRPRTSVLLGSIVLSGLLALNLAGLLLTLTRFYG